MKNTIAVILARGGSKGIPNKNIKIFNGLPLVAWSVIQAKISKISKIYLSSDSNKILNIERNMEQYLLRDPKRISGDKSRSESAILHLLNKINYIPDGVVMLEPTAPLRNPKDIDNCIKFLF